MTHICVSKLTIIGSDNGLSPRRRQAIIWTSAVILLIGPFGTKFSEISIEIVRVSFKKMRLKGSSAKWRPFCLGLNELTQLRWCQQIWTSCSWPSIFYVGHCIVAHLASAVVIMIVFSAVMTTAWKTLLAAWLTGIKYGVSYHGYARREVSVNSTSLYETN